VRHGKARKSGRVMGGEFSARTGRVVGPSACSSCFGAATARHGSTPASATSPFQSHLIYPFKVTQLAAGSEIASAGVPHEPWLLRWREAHTGTYL
jgi:hypothetical protein